MICLEENVLLVLDVLNLFLLQEQVFVDALHRVHFPHLAIVDKENLSEAAFVNDLANLEVLQIHNLTTKAWLANEARA